MPVTARAPLGADTLNRKWYLDILDPDGATWLPVAGVQEFSDARDSTKQDSSDFDSAGFKSMTKTAEAWKVEAKIRRGVLPADPTSYDPGQELLRSRGQGKFGAAATIRCRFYEVTDGGPQVEAYEGLATIDWTPEGGSMDATSNVKVLFDGVGALVDITHPGTTPLPVPRVFSVTPDSGPAAGGTLVTIKGSGFTGLSAATAVKFGGTGGTNAASYQVIDDKTISAVTPARAAGAAQVVVTNATGPSVDAVSFTYA